MIFTYLSVIKTSGKIQEGSWPYPNHEQDNKSLDQIIEIQEDPIRRTKWGPCFGLMRVMFWPYLLYIYFFVWFESNIHWKATKDQNSCTLWFYIHILWIIFWPCFGHPRAKFRLFLPCLCFYMSEIFIIHAVMFRSFIDELWKAIRKYSFSIQWFEHYLGHFSVIIGPFLFLSMVFLLSLDWNG